MQLAPGAARRVTAGLVIAIITILADQLSKWEVLVNWPEARESNVPVLSFIDLVLRWNRGVSFSIGNNIGDYDRVIFAALALAVCAGLVLWMARGAKPLIVGALGLVVGGALGNTLDRVRHGAVEDFIYVHIGAFDWWPVFNVGDSAICVGAALMIFDSLFDAKSHKKITP